MAKPTRVIPKKRGRPATGKDPLVATRMPPGLIRAIDDWAARHANGSRSEAIRHLLEQALKAEPPKRTHSSQRPVEPASSLWPMPSELSRSGPTTASKASDLAAQQIDKLVDPSVPVEEQRYLYLSGLDRHSESTRL